MEAQPERMDRLLSSATVGVVLALSLSLHSWWSGRRKGLTDLDLLCCFIYFSPEKTPVGSENSVG
jgi:hypothetical protein